MSVFVERPFWATSYPRSLVSHMRSVVVTAPVIEPLTVAQGKRYARDDAYDESLMADFIRAARAKVELDTGLALLTQTRDVLIDVVPGDVIQLPAQSKPLQSVTSVKTIDTDGDTNTLATDQYLVDTASGRISLSQSGVWPSDLRTFQPWVIRIVAGWTSSMLIPPLLVHAVGLMTAHYANAGRDILVLGAGLAAVEMPFGYEAAIESYRVVTLA